jgi:hypothetical protein
MAMATSEEIVAELTGITGLDTVSAAQVVDMARMDPPGAAQLLQAYEAAMADGTPSFIEKAWTALQVGLNIAMPLASALETIAGVPGALKSI